MACALSQRNFDRCFVRRSPVLDIQSYVLSLLKSRDSRQRNIRVHAYATSLTTKSHVDPCRSVGTLDITRDMTRQYKGMQEELLNRINQLEGTIQVIT